MTLEQAKTLRAALDAGIAQAEASGSDQVELVGALQALDDAARDELEQAIKEHRGA